MFTRRDLVIGSAVLLVLPAGCQQPDEAVHASAARNSNRQEFVDTIGWVEPEGNVATIAFSPFRMSDTQRRAVLDGRSVYPALPGDLPMLEMRIQVRPRRNEEMKISVGTLESVQLTFWHFDDPPAVIRIEKTDWSSSPELDVSGLDGEMRRSGYALGTIRGRQIYKNARQVDEAYLFNLRFVQSLA